MPRPPFDDPTILDAFNKDMELLGERFSKGDEWSLITAMNHCAVYDIAMPEWAARAWLKRSRSAMHYRVDSWDAVMPRIKPPGRKLAALRDQRRWTLAVVMEVHRAHKAGRAIGTALFDELADTHRWPFGGDKAKKLYYAAKKAPAQNLKKYF